MRSRINSCWFSTILLISATCLLWSLYSSPETLLEIRPDLLLDLLRLWLRLLDRLLLLLLLVEERLLRDLDRTILDRDRDLAIPNYIKPLLKHIKILNSLE
jgi:hypothetical protein